MIFLIVDFLSSVSTGLEDFFFFYLTISFGFSLSFLTELGGFCTNRVTGFLPSFPIGLEGFLSSCK